MVEFTLKRIRFRIKRLDDRELAMRGTNGFRPRFLTTTIVALVTSAGLGSTVTAQLFSPDPYDPYGRAYRAYAYPGAGYNPSLPNATRFSQGATGANNANQFQGFLNDPGLGTFGRSSRYDGAFRKFDSAFDRNTSPGDKADAKYFEERERREQAMIRAMVERDPKKRDELVRKADAEAKKSGGILGPSVRRGGSAASVPSAPALTTRVRAARTPAANSGASPGATPTPSTGAAPLTPEARRLPPAPSLPDVSERRSPSRVDAARVNRPARSPSEVLERSRRANAPQPADAKTPSPTTSTELPR